MLFSSFPSTFEPQSAGLGVAKAVQSFDEVASEGQFVIVGPFPGQVGDRIPVEIRDESPHYQLCDSAWGLISSQSFEGCRNMRISIHLCDIAGDPQPLALFGQVAPVADPVGKRSPDASANAAFDRA